jgi:hypothetical protein
MPSAREVASKFQTLIDGQVRLIDDLSTERRKAVDAAKEEREQAVRMVRRLAGARITSPDAEGLSNFNEPAGIGRKAFDLPAMASELRAKAAADTKLYEQVKSKDSGKPSGAIAISLAQAETAREGRKHDVTAQQVPLRRILSLNTTREQKGRPAISLETEADYGKPQFFRYIFSPSFREARDAITAYEKANKGQSPFRRMEGLSAAKQAHAEAGKVVTGLREQLDIANLREGILDDRRITVKLQEAITKRAEETPYIDTLTARFPGQLKGAVEHSVKADVLGKVAGDLDQQIRAASQTQEQLEKPMSKLRRAGSRSVRVDTDDIAYKVTGQNAMMRLRSENAGKVREQVGSYRSDTSITDSTMFQAAMLYVILSSSDTDPYFTVPQTGADAGIAGKAGLDLGNLTPDVSGIDTALASTGIDVADFNLGGVDVGNFHVDVGGIASGLDVSVPSIDVSVPTIDVSPSFDGGFSGGF